MTNKLRKEEESKPRIDPSTSPYTEHNLDAIRKLGWRYVPRHPGLYESPAYVDRDGELVADRFGQPLG